MRSRRFFAAATVIGLLIGGGVASAAVIANGTVHLSAGDNTPVDCPNRLTTSNRQNKSLTLHCASNFTTTVPTGSTTTSLAPVTTTTTILRTTTTTSIPATTTTTSMSGALWHPGTGNLPWQWEIGHALNTNSASDMGTGAVLPNGTPAPNPIVYDIDGFDNPASTVAALHSRGATAICYIEVGAAENYRSDYSQFPAAALGNTMPGYSAERYVDIRNSTVVGIIENRIAMCKSKGFDAIEPDIDESFASNTGFPLTQAIEENYMKTLISYSHAHGIAMIMKNPDDASDSYATDMVPFADGDLSEQCNQYSSCNPLKSYVAAGKPVFNAEYSVSTATFCPTDNAADFNGAKFNVNLNGGRSPCR